MSKSDDGNAMFPTPGHRLEFIAKVRLLGVHEILVEFSGSGDSGTIEDPAFLDRTGANINDKVAETVLAWPGERSEWNKRMLKWVKKHFEAEDTPLKEVVANMCNTALEATQLDWYNNDGGQGSFLFKFPPEGMTVELSVGINHTETNEHTFEY